LVSLRKKFPREPEIERSYALTLERLGGWETDQRRYTFALTRYRELTKLQEERALRDPTNMMWKFDFSFALYRLADVLLKIPTADKQEALDHLDQAKVELEDIGWRQGGKMTTEQNDLYGKVLKSLESNQHLLKKD
jgi:tetratricopeptide (TPR) repeat protein